MVTKIMPLGASNTYGMYEDSTSPGSYRGPLQYMLQFQGVSYDFVGLDRGGAIPDAEHNGHSGKTIEWFTSRYVNEAIYDRNGTYSHTVNTGTQTVVQYMIDQADLQSTDVILLLAGTNNVIQGDSAEAMLVKMDGPHWCVSYNGGVEVLQINGRLTLTEGTDFVFF